MFTLLAYFLLVSLGINMVLFLFAFRLKSDKLTDISYAATFALLAGIAFALSDRTIYHVVLLSLLLIWAGRIGGFLLYRVLRVGKDKRFDGMREDFAKFARFWALQGLTVWIVMLSAVLAFQNTNHSWLLTSLGTLIWLGGFTVEALADIQKYRFNDKPANRGKWVDTGLWRYSRHPNYFGEILVWVGIYCVALASVPWTQAIVGGLSPLFITILLVFVSGIPLLEKAADKKWGQQKQYREYRRTTSVLIPLFKKR